TNPMWEQVRDHQQAFTGVFAWSTTQFDLSQSGLEQRVEGIYASGEYFATLGVRAEAGRLLGAADDARACAPVADISDGFWRSHYGGAASALGATLVLSGHPFQVIGVTPPAFFGMEVGARFNVAVPLCAQAIVSTMSFLEVRDAWWLTVGGRIAPGETLAATQAQLAAQMPAWLAASLPADWGASDQQNFLRRRLSLLPAGQGVSRLRMSYALPLEILLGVAGLVLLVACVNLAGLMLARAIARRDEMATRLALGASRLRLIRQLLTESLLLAVGGAALGSALAVWACRALERYWGSNAAPVALNLSLDRSVLGFTIVLTLLTAAVVGLIPALRATGTALARGGRGATARAPAAGRRLAAAQVAVSLLLLACAAMFVRSFVNLTRVQLGFDPGLIELVNVSRPPRPVPDAALLIERSRILAALRAIPGVASASESLVVPTTGLQWDDPLRSARGSIGDAYFNPVSPGYFATLRTPLLAGRDFSDQDTAQSPPVAILNQSAARILFPAGSALGQLVQQSGRNMPRPTRVIGIVADAKYDASLRAAAPPEAYYALAQLSRAFPGSSFEVSSTLPAAAIAPAIRAAMARAAPEASYSLGRLSAVVAGDVKPERLLALLSALFGGLALLLTGIGLYGMVAYHAARRRREFGVRVALGARPQAVLRLALRDFVLTLG
ncbi:MAG: ABC transporter permease, partial [Terriglobales bacterium]